MAKVKPLPEAAAAAASSPSSQQGEQKPAVYTVWMKSLVFNGNGCTVYGADGRLAYRIDNYGCRGGREVFFMDRAGNNLIRIQRKVVRIEHAAMIDLPAVFRLEKLLLETKLSLSPRIIPAVSTLSFFCRHCYAELLYV